MEKLTYSPNGELVVIYGGETNPGDKSPFCCLYGAVTGAFALS